VKALPTFAETAASCALKGELCVQHCFEELANGEVVFSNCSIAAHQMVVVCELVSKVAALKSVRLTDLLDVCTAACKACKEACDEHKSHWSHGMHLECKACSEHCDKMLTEIVKLKTLLGKA
jgi:Cys-rich four helix bundle protein (predicted Tat secretion target)